MMINTFAIYWSHYSDYYRVNPKPPRYPDWRRRKTEVKFKIEKCVFEYTSIKKHGIKVEFVRTSTAKVLIIVGFDPPSFTGIHWS